VFDPTQIHAYLRAGAAGAETERVGPFLATFTPGTDHPMRNYAIPDDDARPRPSEVDALVETFRSRGLKPRLEYADEASTALLQVLLEAGFEVEAKLPVMVCVRGHALAVTMPTDFEVGLALTDEDHADALRVANEAYGERAEPGADEVRALGRMVARGGAVALARHLATGEAAGSGIYPAPRESVSELAAIGTRERFRRQGVALGVTSALTISAFETGIELLWLTPEHEASERIYARVGFRSTNCHMIHISSDIRHFQAPDIAGRGM
jgi:hypothetical protein